MSVALREAEAAALAGDVPVGALVVDANGVILAQAGNRVERDCDPSAHAEILVLRASAKTCGLRNLASCILVTTLEPCLMCTGAIALSRIAGVVFGAADARAGSLISAADSELLPLGGSGFWRLGGIQGDVAARQLRNFFKNKRN